MSAAARPLAAAPGAPPSLVALVSGKGGVGRTNLAANLAVAAARLGARPLLVDGDLGLANVDVLLGLVPEATLADFAAGVRALPELLLPGPRGVAVLPAASAREDLAALPAASLAPLLAALQQLAAGYDLALVDAAAGIGPAVVGFAGACARRLLIATPEPTSLADAYATLKVLERAAGPAAVGLVVNEARDERDARATHERLARLAARFLGLELDLLGWLPRDPRLAEAVARQQPVVEAFPTSPSARAIAALARVLLDQAVAAGEATAGGS